MIILRTCFERYFLYFYHPHDVFLCLFIQNEKWHTATCIFMFGVHCPCFFLFEFLFLILQEVLRDFMVRLGDKNRDGMITFEEFEVRFVGAHCVYTVQWVAFGCIYEMISKLHWVSISTLYGLESSSLKTRAVRQIEVCHAVYDWTRARSMSCFYRTSKLIDFLWDETWLRMRSLLFCVCVGVNNFKNRYVKCDALTFYLVTLLISAPQLTEYVWYDKFNDIESPLGTQNRFPNRLLTPELPPGWWGERAMQRERVLHWRLGYATFDTDGCFDIIGRQSWRLNRLPQKFPVNPVSAMFRTDFSLSFAIGCICDSLLREYTKHVIRFSRNFIGHSPSKQRHDWKQIIGERIHAI